MIKRKLALAAGALVLVGGAVAIAAVGHREGRMHRDRPHGMEDFAQGPGMGMGDERGRGHHRGGHSGPGDAGGQDMRRGWFDRSLTTDEFEARTRERFARLDKNSDGVIDAAEVEAEITRATERRGPMRERMMQRFGRHADTDRDGRVTRQEALDRAKRDFARIDLDSDGRITDADLPPMMRGRDVLKGEASGMGRRGGGFGLARIIGADANKDGIVTQDEYVSEAGRRFDQFDRNKDNSIDKADRDAMTKEMTDYRVRRFLHSHGAGKENQLTREQFMASAKQRFTERDTNSDGRLDREDRGRGMRLHRGHGPDGHGESGPGRGGRGPDDRGAPR